ncbi:hypothetical protein DV515_00009054 [Chloebia gouldiae]|uniref:Uncharacterized protein n=1 Tax=Chloebia gouldiae TaxID=44316 RepID=A0A3L8SCN5_CHLGU|nr:hypothetical protein DV515_00009054 [Chloebia gouldiae]
MFWMENQGVLIQKRTLARRTSLAAHPQGRALCNPLSIFQREVHRLPEGETWGRFPVAMQRNRAKD